VHATRSFWTGNRYAADRGAVTYTLETTLTVKVVDSLDGLLKGSGVVGGMEVEDVDLVGLEGGKGLKEGLPQQLRSMCFWCRWPHLGGDFEGRGVHQAKGCLGVASTIDASGVELSVAILVEGIEERFDIRDATNPDNRCLGDGSVEAECRRSEDDLGAGSLSCHCAREQCVIVGGGEERYEANEETRKERRTECDEYLPLYEREKRSDNAPWIKKPQSY
jgi:hypothetical protein